MKTLIVIIILRLVMNLALSRSSELDFLKGVFIILMVAFHLFYFASHYPWLCSWVYTYHMPGFLLISGYLMRVNKELKQVVSSLRWLLVPYVFFETLFFFGSTFLPISGTMPEHTILGFFEMLLFKPLGNYWYLFSVFLYGTCYLVVFRLGKLSLINRLFILALSFYLLGVSGFVRHENSLYFFIGIVLRQSDLLFLDVFRPSWWALPAIVVLAFYPTTFDRGTIGGMLTVFSVISFLLVLYNYIPLRLKEWVIFLGRNSLIVYVYSPLFTNPCTKYLSSVLVFDSTRILFLVIALPLSILGTLLVGKILDALRISPLLIGRTMQ